MTSDYNAIVLARKVGAIGIFYPVSFVLRRLPVLIKREEIVDAWLEQYGSEWELHYVKSFSTVYTETEEVPQTPVLLRNTAYDGPMGVFEDFEG